MSSPAAASPVAVLVLAWDETTPAARVLVEPADFAEPALSSVAVLVPTVPPSDTLTQEEFLPLEDDLMLLGLTDGRHPAARAAEVTASQPYPTENNKPAAEDNISTAETPAASRRPAATATAAAKEAEAISRADNNPTSPDAEAALAATEAAGTGSLPATTEPAASSLPAAATAAALVKPALVWQQVRVLHFTRATLVEPTLVWEGAGAAPAAPYLGSSAPAPATPGALDAGHSAVAAAYLAGAGSAASALGALLGPELPGSGPAPAVEELPASAPPAYLPTELPAAPDAESDGVPAPHPAGLLLADAATPEPSEAATDPAEPFRVDVSAVQIELAQPAAPPVEAPEAIAPPASESQRTPAPEASAPFSLEALHPAGQPFDAPDLNFQIIQYARQAVPQALAESPFGVIYAPAWPTWLAAQELRQRTGQPLVLHLAQLAAADDELIDLAAGWVAEIQRQALHRADLILTETPALAQRLRHELALPAYRVRTVPAADAAAVAQALGSVVRG